MSPVTTRTRIGLAIAAFLAIGDVVSAFFPTPDGEVGPPLPIVLLGGLLGVITLVAVVVALRTGRRGALRIVAGTRVLSAITALPAFFVDVVLTVVSVVLVLSPARRAASVTD
jgi:hypothetical protein